MIKLRLITILALLPIVLCTTANRNAFWETQPDGVSLCKVYLQGDAHSHFLTDEKGYVVLKNKEEWLVYAELSNGTKLYPGNERLGISIDQNFTKENNIKRVHKTELISFSKRGGFDGNGKRSLSEVTSTATEGVIRHLVIPMKFRDHEHRVVPTQSSLEILFNEVGGHGTFAPTGSVRDVFLHNSYGALNFTSTVYKWVLLPKNESYYADSIDGNERIIEAVHAALNIVHEDDNFSFRDFDQNEDGFIDAITFLHSGYGAEWGGVDCYGTHYTKRVWSHKLTLNSNQQWKTKDDLKIHVHRYQISSSMFGMCGSKIARIGTISHELGHFLGLPDLYDKGGIGAGVGSYCLMGDSWGFDGSQLYPGMMSAWSKMFLGWVEPQILSTDGTYSIQGSSFSKDSYRINLGDGNDEYLLIENRQNIQFDHHLHQGGLAIWHIDEKVSQLERGYPGQVGWPRNGKHYRVALLQADGKYDLEHGNQLKGQGDLFHKGGVNELGPSTDLDEGPHPSTDSYQGGIMRHSGVRIYDISEEGSIMTFGLEMIDDDNDIGNEREMKNITTTFEANSGLAGNMFSIIAEKNVSIEGFSIHMMPIKDSPLSIWVMKGSYKGYEQNRTVWTQIASTNLTGLGPSKPTPIPKGSFQPITIISSEIVSFYITLARTSGMRYTIGEKEGRAFSRNDDLVILEGAGVAYFFGETFSPRIWNGFVDYHIVEEFSKKSSIDPSIRPSLTPTSHLSKVPTIRPSYYVSSSAPSISVFEKELKTTFVGGSGLSGNMFTIEVLRCIEITGFHVNIVPSEADIEVWIKNGSYVGYEHNPDAWGNIVSTRIEGRGQNEPTLIPSESFHPLRVHAPELLSLYVTLTTKVGMRYSVGSEEGRIFAQNDDIRILEGIGMSYQFQDVFSPRIWNGAILYRECDNTTIKEEPPTSMPSRNCPDSKRWNSKKSKCVKKCKKKKGFRYDWNLKKCVKVHDR